MQSKSRKGEVGKGNSNLLSVDHAKPGRRSQGRPQGKDSSNSKDNDDNR
jgi:hypothetical protein